MIETQQILFDKYDNVSYFYRMKVTALIPDTIIDEVKKYSNGKNITDSLIIALEDWIALQKLKNLNSLVLETPLSFERNFSAEKVRKINQRK
jgi:hypothetical protein